MPNPMIPVLDLEPTDEEKEGAGGWLMEHTDMEIDALAASFAAHRVESARKAMLHDTELLCGLCKRGSPVTVDIENFMQPVWHSSEEADCEAEEIHLALAAHDKAVRG